MMGLRMGEMIIYLVLRPYSLSKSAENMSSNDETYLEAFIESTASLPHDLRRNLDLLKVLDKSCV